MTEKLVFTCVDCGCEYEWYEEDGSQCHCFDEWEEEYFDDDYDFDEAMGTA